VFRCIRGALGGVERSKALRLRLTFAAHLSTLAMPPRALRHSIALALLSQCAIVSATQFSQPPRVQVTSIANNHNKNSPGVARANPIAIAPFVKHTSGCEMHCPVQDLGGHPLFETVVTPNVLECHYMPPFDIQRGNVGAVEGTMLQEVVCFYDNVSANSLGCRRPRNVDGELLE